MDGSPSGRGVDSGRRAELLDLKAELEISREQGRAAARPVILDLSAVGRISRVDAIQRQQMAAEARRRPRRVGARPEAPVCLPCPARLDRER